MSAPASASTGAPTPSGTTAGTPPTQRLAKASLWLGVLGNLGLGPLTGVPAVIAGHLAFARSRKSPSTHGGRGVAIAGFVLGYVSFLLGLPVLAILLTVTVPPIQRLRTRAETTRCQEQLVNLARDARTYAQAHDGAFPQDLTALPASTAAAPHTLLCPMGRGGPYKPVRLEWLGAGKSVSTLSEAPLLRCPAHGHTVSPDGTIQPGRPGLRRSRSSD